MNKQGEYCGFCGKPEQQVARLIEGPLANICNECVELCNDIIEQRFLPGALAERLAARRAAQGTEAGTAETEGLGPKDDGPVPVGNAPK